MSSEPDPAAFFAEITASALATAKAAPELVDVTPLIGRGWCLDFRVANEWADIVQVNALAEGGGQTLAYSYRPASVGSPQRERRLDRVGLLLCKALERVPIDGELPPVAVVVDDPDDEPPPRENVSFWLPGDCDRGCEFCSVSVEPSAERALRLPLMQSGTASRERADLEAKLRVTVDRAAEICIEWSGKDCLLSPLFDDGLRLAHELGYRDMGIQTPGSRLLEDGFVEFLRAHSVVRAGLTAHAGDEATFDLVGGKAGAYTTFWAGLERLLAADFQVSLEVPCVAKTVEGLPEHVANLASYPCSITCFFWYPDDHMGDSFPVIGMAYERAIAALERLRELVPPQRVAIDGIPECAVSSELRQHFFWSYGGGHMTFIDFERVPACASCSARDRCPGVPPVYLQHHEFPYQPLAR
ncbi:radical SAM protein [Enhygromyxa salina]|uniref:Radical SAM core domain-containing protein n=1 Tax=Enhygromyxa salina TaxID=215803 RepID=A0A2S9YMV6_9BACT|nr:radical SAM protein [Enhygromyxa salina]PRQ06416.1 hypothetical protein ENSA7_38860 [Enhygromyxa salina]